MTSVDERLVEAIQDGRLRPVLEELIRQLPGLDEPSRVRVTEASDALADIDAAVDRESRRVVEQLADAGVDVSSGPNARPDRPLHRLAIEIARRDVDRAVRALECAGYHRYPPTDDSAWRAFQHTRTACGLMRTAPEPFRVELTWRGGRWPSHGLVGRLLTPSQDDFDAISLPGGLWPAYVLVRLLRLPVRRLRQGHEPLDLGPFLQTPSELIEPLLRFADLSSSEVLVDLGCGDGRIVVAAAKTFGCRCRGFEIDATLVARARATAAAAGVADRVEILCADAALAPLDDADVVMAFLPVATIEALRPAILARMPAGSRFVAHEQERVGTVATADARMPLFSTGGITVAHRWNR